MTGERYLPLLNDDGSWIERPDLYLLVRLGSSKKVQPLEVSQIHTALLSSDPYSDELNNFERGIAKGHISHDLRLRSYAGNVVIAACRIAQATNEPPTATIAIKLVAFNHHTRKKTTTLDALKREVRRGTQLYRDTMHLQAAMQYGDPSLHEIEGSEEVCRRFLARARGFEDFIEHNLINEKLQWDPWRVPKIISANHNVELKSLSRDERSFLELA